MLDKYIQKKYNVLENEGVPMAKKPIQYVKCPRCDLNYIPKSEKYSNVCKRALGLIVPDEDDITDLELCPI